MRTETVPAAACPRPGSRAPRGLGALAGLLACGAALGVAELAAGVVGAQTSPLVAVGGSAIDATPEWLKDFAVRTFGERDKLVLLDRRGFLVTGVAVAMNGEPLPLIHGFPVRMLVPGLYGYVSATDAAFSALPKATLDAAMADPKGLLTSVLAYHVVEGKLSPEMLAGTHRTLQGGTIEITGSGENFKVNGQSGVVCGNVQTANATVYIIDNVLLPKG
jgi:hypothetical protein